MSAQTQHFAKQCMDEIRMLLAPQLAQARERHGPGFMLTTLNETMLQQWQRAQKQAGTGRLSEYQQDLLHRQYLEAMRDSIGAVIADELMDGALMYVYFQGFVQQHALPRNRAEALLAVPSATGAAPQAVAEERLTGAHVVPFLRGHLFEQLGERGFSVRADLYTLMALVDELLANPAPPALTQHINIEPASLIDAHFYGRMEEQLRRLPKTHLARVCLEITERGRARLVADKLQHLSRMRDVLGISIAYDDYMGHTWEDEQLKILQPTSVKIDGHIIKTELVELEGNPIAYAENLKRLAGMVETIARTCPRTHIVAEWTETVRVYKDMAKLGVHGVQSYVLNAQAAKNPALLLLDSDDIAEREARMAMLDSLRGA
ncbi:MAG: EAL domain-containing protein [Pseudomonadaceae bacterium]|nr:EAL domain-containing protein [Pseudomonadaceae bacterium]